MTRQSIINFIEKTYSAPPERLWLKYPNYCVFRKSENQKWFAVIMDVDCKKIGLDEEGKTDILVLKGSPDDIVHIVEAKGFCAAYHMNKKHWYGVILKEQENNGLVFELIEKSCKLL